LSKVGIGSAPRGILCVSSGSGNSVNLAGLQRAPNAADAQKIQYNKSKNSELAHAKVIVGRLNCITEKYISHYTRPIGSTPTSGVRPNWWYYPRRKCRGEVSGDVHTSVHAQCWNWNEVEQSEQLERWGQCNLRYPPTANAKLGPDVQGGVVDSRWRISGLGPSVQIHGVRQTRQRACTRDGSTSVVCKIELLALSE